MGVPAQLYAIDHRPSLRFVSSQDTVPCFSTSRRALCDLIDNVGQIGSCL